MGQNKEGVGFVRFRWGETKEQDAVGGARLTIEIGAEFPIGIIGLTSGRNLARLASAFPDSHVLPSQSRFRQGRESLSEGG